MPLTISFCVAFWVLVSSKSSRRGIHIQLPASCQADLREPPGAPAVATVAGPGPRATAAQKGCLAGQTDDSTLLPPFGYKAIHNRGNTCTIAVLVLALRGFRNGPRLGPSPPCTFTHAIWADDYPYAPFDRLLLHELWSEFAASELKPGVQANPSEVLETISRPIGYSATPRPRWPKRCVAPCCALLLPVPYRASNRSSDPRSDEGCQGFSRRLTAAWSIILILFRVLHLGNSQLSWLAIMYPTL
jgi:hypothetical protein